VVYFRGIKEEKRKTTIQITVNVERTRVEYSSEVNREDEVEILIKYYRKKVMCLKV
jgi:hypothetical protein